MFMKRSPPQGRITGLGAAGLGMLLLNNGQFEVTFRVKVCRLVFKLNLLVFRMVTLWELNQASGRMDRQHAEWMHGTLRRARREDTEVQPEWIDSMEHIHAEHWPTLMPTSMPTSMQSTGPLLKAQRPESSG